MSLGKTPGREGRRVAWIVDDSPLEVEMARRALAPDHEVEVYADGSAVLEQLTTRPPPDILILDWVMPGLSGIDVCRFVRSRPDTAELAILLLTTNQRTEQVVEGLGAGANDYLAKPYAALELQARVGALLRSRALRERAEHAEQLLRRVLGQLPDAVITIDSSNRILFANDTAETILGGKIDELRGRIIFELIPNLVIKVVATNGRQAALPDVTLEGKFYSPRVSIPPSDDEGNTTITLRDVTELRVKESRQVDFYSMVAHDLRSPLAALQMRNQMLMQGMRGPISGEVRVELEKMGERVRDLVQLVTDFLDVAQMEAAQFHIEHRELDLSEICARVYDEYRPLAGSRQLELSLSAPHGARVSGDARRLTQVVGNLVSNAIKFTAKGQVSIAVTIAASIIEISVTDTGRGIEPEAQARLFTKYERLQGSSEARAEGTGLGLVIVKEIIEAHGGTVGVRSTVGKGSTFWCKLPRASGGQ